MSKTTFSAFLKISCFNDWRQVLRCHRWGLLSTWGSEKHILLFKKKKKKDKKWSQGAQSAPLCICILYLIIINRRGHETSIVSTRSWGSFLCSFTEAASVQTSKRCVQAAFVWKSGNKTGSCLEPVNSSPLIAIPQGSPCSSALNSNYEMLHRSLSWSTLGSSSRGEEDFLQKLWQ